jgi:hypothetical protein
MYWEKVAAEKQTSHQHLSGRQLTTVAIAKVSRAPRVYAITSLKRIFKE